MQLLWGLDQLTRTRRHINTVSNVVYGHSYLKGVALCLKRFTIYTTYCLWSSARTLQLFFVKNKK